MDYQDRQKGNTEKTDKENLLGSNSSDIDQDSENDDDIFEVRLMKVHSHIYHVYCLLVMLQTCNAYNVGIKGSIKFVLCIDFAHSKWGPPDINISHIFPTFSELKL